jgi:hypothetical protein
MKNADQRQEYYRQHALAWYHANTLRARANNKKWYESNKSVKNSRRGALLQLAGFLHPGYRVLYAMRGRLSGLIRARGEKRFSITGDVLLYSADELRAHLERQFEPGMSWENYGTDWEVDHIRPCAEFDLTDINQCKECYALENLRPLDRFENRSRYHRDRRKGLPPQSAQI